MITDPILIDTLKLLVVSLNHSEYDLPNIDSWQEIQCELEAHTLLPLVSDYVMQSDMPAENKLQVTKKTISNVRFFHKLMIAQSALLKLFKEHKILAAVIKGAAAAQYYPRPALRQYGDIDILVMPDNYDKACEVLVSSGYKRDCSHNDDRHIGFQTQDGIEIELHCRFSSGSSKTENALLDSRLYDGLKNTKEIALENYSVCVLPPLENGLVLLGHINQHLSEGLGLRQIIDWMMYVQTELNDVFWEEQFKTSAETVGMDYLAKIVTKMCQLHLGLSKEITWCADADESLANELMLYLFSKGNFGRKAAKESIRPIAIVHSLTNPIDAFRYLTEKGAAHMKKAGLKPRKAYAWFYQIGHLLIKAATRNNKGTFAKEIEQGLREAAFLKRLRVTKM